MKTYKDIPYFTVWMRGNWYLIIPEFQKMIHLDDDFNDHTIQQVIDNEVCQFL